MKARVNGVDIRFDDEGQGPCVLLLHGFPLCARMWKPQREALAAGYRVITPDLRGMGGSGSGASPVSMADYAADQLALMDHLGIESFVAGGMSMGGYVLLEMLDAAPKRIRGACFLLTRATGDDEAGRARRTLMAQRVREGQRLAVPDAFESLLFAERTLCQNPHLVAQVRSWMTQASPRGLVDGLTAMRDRRDFSERLDRIRQPCLVVGGEQDRAIPLAEILLFEQRLPSNRTCMIGEAGHMANLERPEIFNDCLLGYLRGLELS